MSKIWFVEFPTFQYNEDVKALAKENGLTIIDAYFDDGTGEKDVPKLTKKGEEVESKGANIDKMIENLDKLKAPSLKTLAEHFGIDYTNADETREAIRAKVSEQ